MTQGVEEVTYDTPTVHELFPNRGECPLCHHWRPDTIRLKCPGCGLSFRVAETFAKIGGIIAGLIPIAILVLLGLGIAKWKGTLP